MHPELKEIGWDTVLKKNQIYNNCKSTALGFRKGRLLIRSLQGLK